MSGIVNETTRRPIIVIQGIDFICAENNFARPIPPEKAVETLATWRRAAELTDEQRTQVLAAIAARPA